MIEFYNSGNYPYTNKNYKKNHPKYAVRFISLMAGPVAQKSASSTEVSHSFSPGDMVEVCEGELIHLLGKVIRIDGNKITMLPKHKVLTVSTP